MKIKEVKIKFLLNYFDDVTNATTSSGLSDEMKTYYAERLIDLAGPKLVYDQFGQKANIPKNGGKTIEFRKYDNLPKAMTPLTEGVTPDGQALNVTVVTATIKQYGAFIRLTDVLELTAIDKNVLQATKLCGEQAGQTLDSITRDIVCAGTNVLYAPKKTVTVNSSTGVTSTSFTEITSRESLDEDCKFSVDLVLKAATILKAQNTPTIDGSYWCIVHPWVSYDLMNDERWIDAHKYTTPENIYNGEIGKIGNVRFVESSEAKIVMGGAGSSLGIYLTMLVGENAYGTTAVEGGGLQHIVKPLGSGEDPLNQRSTVGWKAIKTALRLVEQYMIRIESTASNSASITTGN